MLFSQVLGIGDVGLVNSSMIFGVTVNGFPPPRPLHLLIFSVAHTISGAVVTKLVLAEQLIWEVVVGVCGSSSGFLVVPVGKITDVGEGEIPLSADVDSKQDLICVGFMDTHLHLPECESIGVDVGLLAGYRLAVGGFLLGAGCLRLIASVFCRVSLLQSKVG